MSPSHPTPEARGVFESQPPALASNLYDRHETHEPTTSYPKQRQQPSSSTSSPTPLLQQTTPDLIQRVSSPASSLQRSLRRTPRFEPEPSPSPEQPRQVHIAAASVGFTPSPVHQEPQHRRDSSPTGLSSSLPEEARQQVKQDSVHNNDAEKELRKDSSERRHSQRPSTSNPSSRPDKRESHRAVRVSKNTHSAILYALEEALRHPKPFTSDFVEEWAQMADLMAAGGAPSTSNGNGMAAARRPTAGPAPTSSPSGIRGPRMIMQERAAREARQRAEAEQLALERSRAEQEARLLEEARRRDAERRSAGVAAGQGSGPEPPQQSHPTDPPHRQSQPAQQQRHQHQQTTQPQPRTSATATAANPHHTQPQQQIPTQYATSQQQQPQSPTYVAVGAGGNGGRQRQSQQQSAPHGNTATDTATNQPAEPTKPRNSFPHAFERWETLSAHWEGLTSYWIRKLEQNKDDINRDALSQQLARQVTDLSAAGANLFHAVVELQRLRASSERKFQRWFFETRAELERAQEVNAMMDKALERERQDRADAIRDAVDHERGSSKAQKQLAEMRKELAISKEEARRAWEELGRREQEERDRTLSLQSGHPTIVGGVQVVPMTQGAISRQGTTREQGTHQSEYAQGYEPERTTSQAPPTTTSPPTAGPSGTYYRSPDTGHPQGGGRPGGSEGGYSEGEYLIDATGNFVLDSRGNRIPFVAAPPSGASGSDAEAEDYDTPATTNPPSGGYEPTTSAGEAKWTGAYSEPTDYSGQGYGAPGWETVPRHHHPTRLSDVIEEDDERSRTSASQVSRHG